MFFLYLKYSLNKLCAKSYPFSFFSDIHFFISGVPFLNGSKKNFPLISKSNQRCKVRILKSNVFNHSIDLFMV